MGYEQHHAGLHLIKGKDDKPYDKTPIDPKDPYGEIIAENRLSDLSKKTKKIDDVLKSVLDINDIYVEKDFKTTKSCPCGSKELNDENSLFVKIKINKNTKIVYVPGKQCCKCYKMIVKEKYIRDKIKSLL